MSGLTRPVSLIGVGLVLTVLVVWAVAAHIRAVETGSELILEAEGYDPRSLLSGHYAQIALPIGRVDVSGEDAPEGMGDGEWIPTSRWVPVKVVIAQGPDGWAVTHIGRTRLSEVPDGGLVVKADARRRGIVQLRYGIERIYAQQNEAEELEQLLRSPDQTVEIVASRGDDLRLRLKGIIIDGHRRDFSWW